MKTKGLIIMLVCFTFIVGVSCNSETVVSECNLKTKSIGLENDGVTYQYSVVKNIGPQGDKIVDWTVFDVDSGFSVKNLSSASYTFSVRGITNTGAVMYSGSKTCFVTQNNSEDIIIVLYPQFDESNQDSTLTIKLLTTATDGLSACSYVKNLSSSNEASVRIGLSKCSTGFSSASTQLVPGYYEVRTYIFQNGVEVGGNYNIVMIPTGYSKTFETSITPRSFVGFVDISTNPTLQVDKDEVVTFGWVGENASNESNGYWIVGNKVVEDNAMYYTFPTNTEGTFTVEYYRGSQHKTCTITVGSTEKKADVYILNFRCKDFSTYKICVGYEDKTTKQAIPLTKTNMTVGSNFNPLDYETLNLQPIYAENLANAVFAEIADASLVSSLYGMFPSKKNTTLKQLIIHGSLNSTYISNKFPNLEVLVIDGIKVIGTGTVANLASLTTVYIIPPTSGVTSIASEVFNGSGVTKIYVVGPASKVSIDETWTSGNSLTKADIVYDVKLPL